MALLIDGYNLLNASGIVARGRGPGALARLRAALVDLLASSLPPAELARTTVVFDAAGAPPGLPRVIRQGGIVVRFAAGYPDADALIEELIAADSAPRKLTVVSSDHRLHRAARRRRARAVDSDVWLGELLAERSRRRGALRAAAEVQKPVPSLTAGELAAWLEVFAAEAAPLDDDGYAAAADDPSVARPAAASPGGKSEIDSTFNPFPPGYGEDLSDDDV